MIRSEVLKEINLNNVVKGRLQVANDVHATTIQNWIDGNKDRLTTARNLAIICQELKLSQEEVLEPTPINA